MKKPLFAIALAAAMLPAPAFADTDVGVSISIGQPGFYGRIDIGDFPPPALVYPQPVVIFPPAVGVVVQPVYLHVPPGHAKDWKRYCAGYGACNTPVYFVQERWYNDVYVPGYAKRHPGKGKGYGNSGKGKGY